VAWFLRSVTQNNGEYSSLAATSDIIGDHPGQVFAGRRTPDVRISHGSAIRQNPVICSGPSLKKKPTKNSHTMAYDAAGK